MVGDFVPIVAIICTIGLPLLLAIIVSVKNTDAKHAERMAMIEKGVVIEEPEKRANKYIALRNGCVMIGLALGALTGILIEGENVEFYWRPSFLVFITSILGGGIAFIVYFFLVRNMEEKNR